MITVVTWRNDVGCDTRESLRTQLTRTMGPAAVVEDEWRAVLGDERFAHLKEILQEVWESPLIRV